VLEANSDVMRPWPDDICGHSHKALLSMDLGLSQSHSHLTPTQGIFLCVSHLSTKFLFKGWA